MNLVATRSGDLACLWPWIDLESYPVTFSSLSAIIWFARKPRLAFAQIYFKIFIGKQELEEERAAEACQSPYVFPLVTIPFNRFDEIFTKKSHKMQISNGGDQRWAFPSVPVSFRTLSSSQILPVSWILTLLFTPFPNTTFFFCYIPEIICDLALCVFGLCKVES